MQRFKTFVATGLATAGRIYAGDFNAIQDAAAGLYDLTQNIGAATLSLGEAGLQVVRYGAAEARLTGALRTDGILRALGGDIAGTFTSALRDSIPTGFAPYGLRILNTTNNRYEWNRGTDGARDWQPLDQPPSTYNLSGTYVTRPTATTALNGYTYFATDTGGRWLCVAGSWLLIAQLSPIMTNLQFGSMLTAMGSAPYHQQKASIYTDAVAGVLNHFEYDAGSAASDKWYCIGGPPFEAVIATLEQTNISANYVDLTTNIGPSVTVPRTGVYITEFGYGAGNANNIGNGNGIAALHRNNVAFGMGASANVADVNDATWSVSMTNAAFSFVSGDVIKLRYASTNGQFIKFSNRWVKMIPVRIS